MGRPKGTISRADARRISSAQSALRGAEDELAAALLDAVENGAAKTAIAEVMGITNQSVAQRLEVARRRLGTP